MTTKKTQPGGSEDARSQTQVAAGPCGAQARAYRAPEIAEVGDLRMLRGNCGDVHDTGAPFRYYYA